MRRITALFLTIALLLALACAFADGPESHYMSKWRYRRDGFHRATCLDDGCDFQLNAPCAQLSVTYEGETFTACPVCGHNAIGNGRHRRCLVQLYDYDTSPTGDVLVNQYRAPFGSDSDVASAFSVVFEHAGQITVFEGNMRLWLTIDCPAQYELFRVENDELVPCESEYDAARKILTFEVPSGSWMYVILKAA
ncbi:MAG: hypothetical protein II912_00370 [Clostridia bacterium]|nr:hypothetical protein [Clostridia bacterium]